MRIVEKNTGRVVCASAAAAGVLVARGDYHYYGDPDRGSVAETVESSWPDTHAGVDALADELGVEWPDGKKRLTLAEKIAVLEQAGYTPAAAAKD